MSDTATMTDQIRVLVAKPGLDGHDRGAKIVARSSARCGHGSDLYRYPADADMIAEAALQEVVHVVALSVLSGAHLELFPRVVDACREREDHTREHALPGRRHHPR